MIVEFGKKVLPLALIVCMVSMSESAWAACRQVPAIRVRVSAEAADIAIRTDYTSADLVRLAGSASQMPPHPVLGFYASAVGFSLHMAERGAESCDDILLDVRLVTMQRLIELASDVDRCTFAAALRHYRHHAELQAQMLERSGQALQSALRQEMADTMLSLKGRTLAPGVPLDRTARVFVSRWLDQWRTEFPSIQAAGDSSDEIEGLRRACSV